MKSESYLPKVSLNHIPHGDQHPYETLACERYPRNPSAGETVQIGIETGNNPAAETVWCKWQIEGNDLINRTNAVQSDPDESKIIWKVNLPAFSAGDVVQYQLFAQNGDHLTESETFKFGVTSWVDILSIASIEENGEHLIANLTTMRKNLFVRLEAQLDPTNSLSLKLTPKYNNQASHHADDTEYPLTTNWGEINLKLENDPFQFIFTRESDGLILNSSPSIQALIDEDGQVSQFRLSFESPSNEAFYGFGERFNSLDQRGNCLDNHVYGQYTSQGKRSYIPIPFFLSSRGYGMWLQTDRQAYFDLAAANSNVWSLIGNVEDDKSLELSFFFQDHPQAIVQQFTNQTGKPLLPPPWTFGLWMSSNDWNTQEEVIRQLTLAKENNIPATVLVIEAWSDEINFYIWNDARYKKKPASSEYNYNDFEYPKTGHWPDPKKMIEELHQAGVRLVLWQIPVIKFGNPEEHLDETQKDADQEYAIQHKYVVQKSDGTPHRIESTGPWFCNSLVFDFTNQDAADWWFKKREYLLTELGVDGFKTDGAEHIWDINTQFNNGLRGDRGINTYPLAYESAYNRFLKTHRGEDAILFSRAGYTGTQNVSCHWAGDENSTWDAFQATLTAMLNVGLCGVSFMGWDIAGFAGPLPDSDLYLRSVAFSVFCPIMQYHSDYNARRKPSKDRTPWNIQEQSGDPEVISLFRKYTNLRMNLIPYILCQANLSHQNGLPLMRALPLEYPKDDTCRNFPYEYMFGESLLVAPVVEEAKSTWKVYLPEGKWSNFWTGEILQGNQEIIIAVPKNIIPVFQRRGSIVPLNLNKTLELCSPVGNSTEEINNLAAKIFPGDFCEMDISQGSDNPSLKISAHQDTNNVTHIQLETPVMGIDLLLSGNEPRQITINGLNIPQLEKKSAGNISYWCRLPNDPITHIHIPENPLTTNILVS